MTLRHLKIFCEVCKTGSITNAAKNLYIAQPAVSVAISELEKNYNIQLFERINKRLIITEAGKKAYVDACRVLNAFSEFEEQAKSATKTEKLKLGSSLTIGKYMIPHIVSEITKVFPEVKLTVKIQQTKLIEDMITRGELDFALIESKPESNSLKVIPFYEDKLVAVCAADYNVEKEINAADLPKHKFLLREKGSAARDYFDTFCEREKIEITPCLESVSTQAIIQCLTALGGISILSYHLVKDFLTNGTLKQIRIKNADFIRTYSIIMHSNKSLTPCQNKILQLCIQSAERFK